MARRVITQLIDDLDGTAAQQTVRFAIDGKQYEIDLSTPNADRIRAALAPFVDKARVAGRGADTRGTSARRAGRDIEPAAVRVWARANGIQVGDRGRIPLETVARYRAATGR